jgi:hypothetical protein
MEKITVFINGFLAIVTTVYVILTWRILKTSRDSINLMEKQLESSIRPYIVVDVISPRSPLLTLRIQNSGGSPAENLKIRIDRDFFRLNQRQDERNLRNHYAFSAPIKWFPAKAELLFELGMSFKIFEEPDVTPHQFEITCSYEFGHKIMEEKILIDLNVFRGTTIHTNTVVEELQNIKKAIERLNTN